MSTKTLEPRFNNLSELLEALGGIPPARICCDPLPGAARKRDLIRLNAQNNKLFELVDRTLVEKPMGVHESFLAGELLAILRDFIKERDLGFLCPPDLMIEILPKIVRAPDVSFIPWTKRPEKTIPRKSISDLIPDLVVEVLSPSNTSAEITRKIEEYFRAGIILVWTIDPRKLTAEVYSDPDTKTTLDESGTLDGGGVLPGFQLPLAKLFERLEKPKGKKKKKN
jgi:Uma2 family endonuclease